MNLLLLLASKWQQSLEASEETRLVAPGITGTFDTVGHDGPLASFAISGNGGRSLGSSEELPLWQKPPSSVAERGVIKSSPTNWSSLRKPV